MTAKKVLIGCEFGDNRGHVSRCTVIIEALAQHGITAVFVIPIRFAASLPSTLPCEIDLMSDWGAGMSVEPPYGCAGNQTMGDILVQLGFRSVDRVTAALTKWSALLAKHRPDLVIADFAPNLLSAARGRVRTVSVGTGFTCPPSSARSLRTLTGKPAKYDESETLAKVNEALTATDARPLDTLPGLFAADKEIVGTFRELDPYAKQRWSHRYALPSMSPTLPAVAGGRGDEVFVYSYSGVSPESAFWAALKAPGYPVRVYMQAPTPGHVAMFARHGFAVERRPVGFDVVAQRSRLVLSHGGHGIIASGIMSGLPMVMGCFDLEKYLNGKAMMQARAGEAIWVNGSKAIAMAEAIDTVWREEKYGKAAIALSTMVRKRAQSSMADHVLCAVEKAAP